MLACTTSPAATAILSSASGDEITSPGAASSAGEVRSPGAALFSPPMPGAPQPKATPRTSIDAVRIALRRLIVDSLVDSRGERDFAVPAAPWSGRVAGGNPRRDSLPVASG